MGFEAVEPLMRDVDPDTIYPDIFYCLAATSESLPEESKRRLKADLDVLMNGKDWRQPKSKSITLGVKIYKEVGLARLTALVNALSDSPSAKAARRPDDPGPDVSVISGFEKISPTGPSDALHYVDGALSAALTKLTRKSKEVEQ
jgi:hypothetical protein